MARITAIHSGMAYLSLSASPFTNTAGYPDRNDYYGENQCTGSRFANATSLLQATGYYIADTVANNQTTVFFMLRLRVRRAALQQVTMFTWATTGTGTAMHMDMTTAGTFVFYNAAGTTNVIGTTPVVTVGNTRSDWVTIQGKLVVSNGVNNVASVLLKYNGTTFVDLAAGAVPGTFAGLNALGMLSTFTGALSPATNAMGLECDFDQFIADTASYPEPSRWTYLRPNGVGFYQNWSTSNFRDRCPVRSIAAVPTTTALLSTRESYTIQTPRSAGITGNILSAHIDGFTGSCPNATSILYFIRKSSVDTDCTAVCAVDNNERTHHAYFPITTLTPDDVLEIGFQSGAAVGTYRHRALGIWIEHDTAFVAPTQQDVIIERANYTGTGTYLTITPPFPFTFMFISARLGVGAMVTWWQGQDLPTIIGSVGATPGIWTDGTRIEINANTVNFNTAATVYDVLYVQDYENRIFGSGSSWQIDIASPVDTQNYQVLTPMTSPEGLWVQNQLVGSGSSSFPFWHVPIMGTGLAKPIAASGLVATAVELLNATGMQLKKAMFTSGSNYQYPFLALKPTAARNTVLTAITSYTGDGTSGRVISLPTLGGQTPFWVWVFPHSAIAPYSKNDQQASSFPIAGGAGSATGVTAFGVDSMTVDVTLNVNLTVYSVFALVEGTDSGLTSNQYSGIYILDPTTRHDTLWDRSTTPPTTVDLAIPDPTYRTHFVGDRNGR